MNTSRSPLWSLNRPPRVSLDRCSTSTCRVPAHVAQCAWDIHSCVARHAGSFSRSSGAPLHVASPRYVASFIPEGVPHRAQKRACSRGSTRCRPHSPPSSAAAAACPLSSPAWSRCRCGRGGPTLSRCRCGRGEPAACTPAPHSRPAIAHVRPYNARAVTVWRVCMAGAPTLVAASYCTLHGTRRRVSPACTWYA